MWHPQLAFPHFQAFQDGVFNLPGWGWQLEMAFQGTTCRSHPGSMFRQALLSAMPRPGRDFCSLGGYPWHLEIVVPEVLRLIDAQIL